MKLSNRHIGFRFTSEVMLPFSIALFTVVFLFHTITTDSPYDRIFVVPVCVIVIVLAALEIFKTMVAAFVERRTGYQENLTLTQVIAAPEIRFGALVVLYLLAFEYVSFLITSTVFLVLGPMAFSGRRSGEAPVSLKWGIVALSLSFATYLVFGFLLHAPLRLF